MTTAVDVGRYRGRFFQVLQQTERSQTAVMTIEPGEEAGPEEVHAGDQVLFVLEGEAAARVGATEHQVGAGSCVMIPAGTRHHVRNVGAAPLFFPTVYAPPVY